MSDKSGGLLGGILIGSALGVIAGILAAPRAGRETRRVLKKSADALPELAEDLATSVQFQADRLSASALTNWEGTLERLKDAIAAGQAASHQEWQRQAETIQPDASSYAAQEYSPQEYSPQEYSPQEYSPVPAAAMAVDPVSLSDPASAIDLES